MKHLLVSVVAAAAITLTMPSVASAQFAVAPSGRVEMVFVDSTVADTVNQLQSGCMTAGYSVVSTGPNQVVCELPMSMMQSIFTQLAIGNSYSTTPRTFMRLSVGQSAEDSRVQTYVWTETQMAFGQVQQMPLNGEAMQNNLFNFLGSAGGQYPIGTTFPNMSYLGAEGDIIGIQNGRRTMQGWRVRAVVPGGPIDQMGLQVGDVIVRVGRRTFDDLPAFADRLSDVRVGQPLRLVAMRSGAEMEFEGTAQARPPIQWLIRRGQENGAASLVEAQLRTTQYNQRPQPLSLPAVQTAAETSTVEEAQARLAAAQAELAAARVAQAEAELAAATRAAQQAQAEE